MDADFSVVSFVPPGGTQVPIGVLLINTERVRVAFLHDFAAVTTDPEAAEVLSALSASLVELGRELGARALLDYLEDTLSNSIRITSRERINSTDLDEALGSLYDEHVVHAAKSSAE